MKRIRCRLPSELVILAVVFAGLWVFSSVKRMVTGEVSLNERLMLAAAEGNLAGVKTMMDDGASVNMRDSTGATPLMAAAASGDAWMVTGLLSLGAEVNVADDGGRTPLMLATLYDHVAVVELLVQRGADVARRDQHGRCAVDIAAFAGAKRSRVMLEEAGAGFSESGGNR